MYVCICMCVYTCICVRVHMMSSLWLFTEISTTGKIKLLRSKRQLVNNDPETAYPIQKRVKACDEESIEIPHFIGNSVLKGSSVDFDSTSHQNSDMVTTLLYACFIKIKGNKYMCLLV